MCDARQLNRENTIGKTYRNCIENIIGISASRTASTLLKDTVIDTWATAHT